MKSSARSTALPPSGCSPVGRMVVEAAMASGLVGSGAVAVVVTGPRSFQVEGACDEVISGKAPAGLEAELVASGRPPNIKTRKAQTPALTPRPAQQSFLPMRSRGVELCVRAKSLQLCLTLCHPMD